jgi:transposase
LSKIHAVVDTNGLPIRLALTAGEAHDNRLASSLPSGLKTGSMALADRGYDANWIRSLVTKRRAWANMPPRSNRDELQPASVPSPQPGRKFFNKIKQCRRVATRDDKLAANYLAFVQLASIRLWRRANESTSWGSIKQQRGCGCGVSASLRPDLELYPRVRLPRHGPSPGRGAASALTPSRASTPRQSRSNMRALLR